MVRAYQWTRRGRSLVPDIAGQAFGGTASNPIAGLTSSDYGAGATKVSEFVWPSPKAAQSRMRASTPSNGQQTDDVKAQLNAGEFIMPRDVTSWYGEKFFQNLIQKAQNEKGKAQAKPAIGPATAGPPAVVSGPAIPMGAQ